MRCAQHPEAEAIGICVNCGRMVCTGCSLVLRNRMYCQSCADVLFVRAPQAVTVKGRSGILTAGGILAIIAGIPALMSVLVYGVQLLYVVTNPDLLAEMSTSNIVFASVLLGPALLFGPWEIVGGIFALRRSRFRLTLTWVGLGLLVITSWPFCVLAFIFVAMSKSDFKSKRSKKQCPEVGASNRGTTTNNCAVLSGDAPGGPR